MTIDDSSQQDSDLKTRNSLSRRMMTLRIDQDCKLNVIINDNFYSCESTQMIANTLWLKLTTERPLSRISTGYLKVLKLRK